MKSWTKELFKGRGPVKCLFRVDAGNRPGLSFGHLSRCMIFSGVLKEMYNTESLFLMQDLPEGTSHARRSGCRVVTIEDNAPAATATKTLIDLADTFNPDCFVMDLPYNRDKLGAEVLPILRERGIKTILIDDARFYNPGADIVLNSSILAPEKFEPSSDESLFLGPAYFIFDDRFIQEKNLFPQDKTNVVVSFGGADPTNLTGKMVKSLVDTDDYENTIFHVILGPGYANPDHVNMMIQKKEHRFNIIRNPDNIIPYFIAADFVVCAGGRTVYELNYLSKPFIPIASSDLEAQAVKAFIDKGYIKTGLTKWDKKMFENILQKRLFHSGTIYE